MKTKRPEQFYKAMDRLNRVRPIVPFLRHPIRRQHEKYAPFFIVGSGRSGNTLLRRFLFSREDIHIPPETYVLGQVIRSYRRNSHMTWSELVHLVAAQFEYHQGFEMFGTTLRPLVARLITAPKPERSLAFILDSLYRFHADHVGNECTIWGDKTPMNTFALERIASVFPDARFIGMVRDGCDVVASYMKAGLYTNLDEAADRWATSIRLCEDFSKKRGSPYMEVRYEDLVRDPRSTLSAVCSFIGVEFEEKMLAAAVPAKDLGDVGKLEHHASVNKSVFTDSIGKGRRELSADQLEQLQQTIGDLLVELGYPPCV